MKIIEYDPKYTAKTYRRFPRAENGEASLQMPHRFHISFDVTESKVSSPENEVGLLANSSGRA